LNDNDERDLRVYAIPDTHGHAKGEHKPYAEERPLPLTARMLFLWFYHACRRGYPRFLMVADHMNYLTFEDPAAVNLVRRALKLAQAGDLYGAAETAGVDVGHAAVVSQGLQRGMRYSIGAEVDNDPRSRPDAQNIVDAMRPDAIIRSVHFIPITHPALGENWPWPFDNPEFQELFETVGAEKLWEQYVNLLVDAIERLPGHIVGHFFVPAVFGHWPDDAALDAYENRVLDAAEARGMAVEFNTRFLYRENDAAQKARYLEANKRFLRKAKERGIGIAIGSDAHSPKDQGGAFDVVLNVLDELEINEIVFPLAGALRRVALRIVREPEPEPVSVPEPEPPKAAEPAAPTPARPAKPVRKARPASKATRPPETSPERPPARPETAAAAPEPAPPAAPAEPPAPAEPAPPAVAEAHHSAAEAAPPNELAEATTTNEPEPAPPNAPEPAMPVELAPAKAPEKPAVAKPVAAKPVAAKPVAAKPAAAKPVPAKPAPAKPAAKSASPKPAAKPVQAKAAPAKPAAHAKSPAKKAGPAKAGAKKAASAKPSAKKAAPARTAAKKAMPARKAAPAKKASKKPAPARATAKKAAPAKKAAAKKAAPARSAPARKSAAAKKTTKKTATRRR